MIKKLRNKMLMMNMISTLVIILLAFSAIYIITYNNVESKIEQSLYRTFTFHRAFPWGRQQGREMGEGQNLPQREHKEAPQGERPEMPRVMQGQNENGQRRQLRDVSNFSVYVDGDGNVHTDSFFGENSEHYESVANEVLSQNVSEGEFISEGVVWRFMTRELKNGSKIIAIVDISAERGMLRQLIISFTIGTLILLVLIFIISLQFANRSIKPVADAWDKQRQFVADASHELKTPLAAINTNIDVLLSRKESTIQSEEKWLSYVKTELKRLSELSGNLLDMARMDAETKVEKENASISEIITENILNLEAVAYEKGVTLSYDIEENISGKVNASQITRLCLILLDNAIKYSPDGEVVEIALKRNGREQAMLTVKNAGEPISENEIGKIFDRFYRVDKSRSTSGYGLGLAMAKEITEIHKGKITVKSSKESGTEFSVILPL